MKDFILNYTDVIEKKNIVENQIQSNAWIDYLEYFMWFLMFIMFYRILYNIFCKLKQKRRHI